MFLIKKIERAKGEFPICLQSFHSTLKICLSLCFLKQYYDEIELAFDNYFWVIDSDGLEYIMKALFVDKAYKIYEKDKFKFDKLEANAEFIYNNEKYKIDNYHIVHTMKFEEIKKIDYNVDDNGKLINPYNELQQGSKFSKYTHIIKVESLFFDYYYNCTDHINKINENKLVESIYVAKRNDYLEHYSYNKAFLVSLKICSITCNKKDNEISHNDDSENEETNSEYDNLLTVRKYRINTIQNPLERDSYLNLFYDIETAQLESENRMVPYLISCMVDFDSDYVILNNENKIYKENIFSIEKVTKNQPFFSFHSNDLDRYDLKKHELVVTHFINWLIYLFEEISKYCKRNDYENMINIRIVGFNNNNFDDYFILEELRCRSHISVEYSTRQSKVTNCMVRYKNIKIHMTDMRKWVLSSLKKACKDYKIPLPKLDVNIVKINEYFTQLGHIPSTCSREIFEIAMPINKESMEIVERFKINDDTWNVYGLIEYYCERDVIATLQLYKIVIGQTQLILDDLIENKNLKITYNDPMKFISVPQLSGKITQSMFRDDGIYNLIFKNRDFYNFIASTYYGGKCIYGFVGALNLEGRQLLNWDVTSLYPLCMKGYFPYFRNKKHLNEDIKIGRNCPLEYIQKEIDRTRSIVLKKLEEKSLHDGSLHVNFKFFNINKFFLKCEIEPCELEYYKILFPPVPLRIEGLNSKHIEYSYEKQIRTLNSTQIKTLIMLGYKIKLIEHEFNFFITTTKQSLLKFIELFADMKANATDNPTLKSTAKLLMNSEYGKLSMKPSSLLGKQITKKGKIVINEDYVEEKIASSSPHYGGFVTSESQHLMSYQQLLYELPYIYAKKTLEERCGICLYQDTDSLKMLLPTDKNIEGLHYDDSDKSNIKINYASFKISEHIGPWNDEKQEFEPTWKNELECPINKTKWLIILASKVYFIVDENGKFMLSKAKGLTNQHIKSLKLENLFDIIDGKECILSSEGLKKTRINLPNEYQFESKKDVIRHFGLEIFKKKLMKTQIHPNCLLKCQNAEIANNPLNKENLNNKRLQFVCGKKNCDYIKDRKRQLSESSISSNEDGRFTDDEYDGREERNDSTIRESELCRSN